MPPADDLPLAELQRQLKDNNDDDKDNIPSADLQFLDRLMDITSEELDDLSPLITEPSWTDVPFVAPEDRAFKGQWGKPPKTRDKRLHRRFLSS